MSAVFTKDPAASADQASTGPLRVWLQALLPALPELLAAHRADLDDGKRDTSARLVDDLSRHRDVPVPVAEFVGRLVVALNRQPEPFTLPATSAAAPERDLRQITATLTQALAREAIVQPVTRDWLCSEGLRAVEHEFALCAYRSYQPERAADADDPRERAAARRTENEDRERIDRQTRDLLREGLRHLSQAVIPPGDQAVVTFAQPRKLVRYVMSSVEDMAQTLYGLRQSLAEHGIEPLDWLQKTCGLTPEAAALMDRAMAAADDAADDGEDADE
ncbi:hypothetical protein ACPC54_18660 [Kitasatospora sp. NPDC094028]